MFPVRKFKHCERRKAPGLLPSSLDKSTRLSHCCGGTGVPWPHLGRLLLLHSPCSHGTAQTGCSVLMSPQGSSVSPWGLMQNQGSFPGSCAAPAAPAGRSWPSQGWGSAGPSRAGGWQVIDLYSHTHPQLSPSIPHVLIHGGKQVQPVWDPYGERLGSLCCGINHGTRSRAGVGARQGCRFGGNVFQPQTCSQPALLRCYLRDVISLSLVTNTLSPLPGITGY